MTNNAFRQGVAHFNALEFWEAHESWEELWLNADDDDLVRFYQGLIQLAAAYHHMKRGTFSGAVRLFDAALEKLAPFPDGYHDLDRTATVATARLHRSFAARAENLDRDDFPKLQFVHPI